MAGITWTYQPHPNNKDHFVFTPCYTTFLSLSREHQNQVGDAMDLGYDELLLAYQALKWCEEQFDPCARDQVALNPYIIKDPDRWDYILRKRDTQPCVFKDGKPVEFGMVTTQWNLHVTLTAQQSMEFKLKWDAVQLELPIF